MQFKDRLHSMEMMSTNAKAARNPALDFTKGALVLIMVLYHWLNYFYGPHDNRYLRFLTPSFIFITGFLISNVYISKYGISAPQLPKRLLERGLKLLGVFAALNLTKNLLTRETSLSPSTSAAWSAKYFIDMYVTGSAAVGLQAKAVAFYVLVPISYLLILSALLVVLARFYKHTFYAACLVFLVCAVTLDYFELHIYIELLAVGLLGVLAGYLPIERVNALTRHPYWIMLLYLIYLAAVTVWNVVYPLQIIGVLLSLAVIYLLGYSERPPGKIRGCVLLLGKYSLVGYIAQIAILQILHFVLRDVDSEMLVLGISFILAFALTIAAVTILDAARGRSAPSRSSPAPARRSNRPAPPAPCPRRPS